MKTISKLLEEHGNTGELHTAEEVGGVGLPANEEPSFPLEQDKEAFQKPPAFVSAEVTAVLSLELAGGPIEVSREPYTTFLPLLPDPY
jgi:hypothetical protein